ncbi:hypothetical protein DFP92_101865 [Yoonia sediminilitoris]|uniref:Uncharacterized protein n=1 Tax=Yoonia sediminilitoris TaxID=1286148 RepID=A0A2T6KRT0_9RHOB|nr:hypothetical protein C8N45_101865 [Yoonia sediminilitoris]RCW99438.1 hypothetical protein DFP92_101865 [Yoonia sediminilitoris]
MTIRDDNCADVILLPILTDKARTYPAVISSVAIQITCYSPSTQKPLHESLGLTSVAIGGLRRVYTIQANGGSRNDNRISITDVGSSTDFFSLSGRCC